MVKKTGRGKVTAGELQDRLEAERLYQARLAESEGRIRENIAKFRSAVGPLLANLRKIGINVAELRELRKLSPKEYRRAVPVLAESLPRVTYVPLKSEIVTALCHRAASAAFPVLLTEYKKITESELSSLKWHIGDAFTFITTDQHFRELEEVVREKSHGKAREMVTVAFSKMRDSRAVDLLIELLSDEQVAGHAILALGKMKVERTRPHIVPFLNHPKTWIRKQATMALKNLDKRLPRVEKKQKST